MLPALGRPTTSLETTTFLQKSSLTINDDDLEKQTCNELSTKSHAIAAAAAAAAVTTYYLHKQTR
jgi:hypothetical protein